MASATITIEGDRSLSVEQASGFGTALHELVENAVKHSESDAEGAVRVRAVPNAVEIEVADTGPGLPEQERAVLERGRETPLSHGSGIGLWLAYWIITAQGGTIETAVTEHGTTVTVRIPRTAETVEVSPLTQSGSSPQSAAAGDSNK